MGAIDIIQETEGKFKKPEVRVWVHNKTGGDDYYYVYPNVKKAREDIVTMRSKGRLAENIPLIAFGGFEMSVNEFKKTYPREVKKFKQMI